jgi:hypothetical protein
MSQRVFWMILAGSLLPACTSEAGWSHADALSARQLELQVDTSGRSVEVEYHVDPAGVPPAVRAAMDALFPSGPIVGAEKEWNDGTLYWELSREVDGRDVEAMFTPAGALHQLELEVAADSVPADVKRTALEAVDGARPDKWEEIRDAQQELTEFHVKLGRGDERFKVVISLDGVLLAVFRELPAEVEVPVLQ